MSAVLVFWVLYMNLPDPNSRRPEVFSSDDSSKTSTSKELKNQIYKPSSRALHPKLKAAVDKRKDRDSKHTSLSALNNTTVKPRHSPKQKVPSSLQMSNIYNELAFDNKPGGVWKQGFDITYSMDDWKESPLEVFLVPHSHQDPGWRKTIDEYFESQTRGCLDATLSILTSHPNVRFIYAEISFFSLWVDTLSDDEKKAVSKLLKEGRWEIASGGWVMPDEATTHHYAIIDQIIEGHQWLFDKFKYRPNTSWAIDPFGHSTSMAYFLSKLPVNAAVINRIHYEVKKYLALQQDLEFRWRQQWDTTGSSDVLFHVFPFYHYDGPHTCGPDPSVCCQFDFEHKNCPWGIQPEAINPSNIEERADLLADQFRKKAKLFATGDIVMAPLGDDFRYLSQEGWKKQIVNYDKLIDYYNAHPELKIKLRYSTLSEYFTALRDKWTAEKNKPPASFSVLQGDLFTYTDREHDYWSGYFTSRPCQKYITRELEQAMRSAEIIYAYAVFISQNATTHPDWATSIFATLTASRRSLGLFQHHDGVTGTSNHHVTEDFSKKLLEALSSARKVTADSIELLLVHLKLAPSNASQLNSRLTPIDDELSSTTPPKLTRIDIDQDGRWVVLFNPVTYKRNVVFKLGVNGPLRGIKAKLHGIDLRTQATSSQIDDEQDQSHFILHVGPVELGAFNLGLVQLTEEEVSQSADEVEKSTAKTHATNDWPTDGSPSIWLNNSVIALEIDTKTCFIKTVYNKLTKISTPLSIDFIEFHTNKNKDPSGAYLININSPPTLLHGLDRKKCQFNSGHLVDEITITSPVLRHTVRLFKTSDVTLDSALEIENDLQLSDHPLGSFEVVMRVNSSLTSPERSFVTDSNCFQFVKRYYHAKLPLSGNIYPATCAFYIEGDSTQGTTRLNLFTWHSVGVVGNEVPGQVLVWLDRRSNIDDARGLDTTLIGSWVARSKFSIMLETLPSTYDYKNELIPRLTLPAYHALYSLVRPVIRLSSSKSFISSTNASRSASIPTVISNDYKLPCDVDLMMMRILRPSSSDDNHASFVPGFQLGCILHRVNLAFPPNLHIKQEFACRKSRNSDVIIPKAFIPFGDGRRALPTDLDMLPSDRSGRSQAETDKISVKPSELEAFVLV